MQEDKKKQLQVVERLAELFDVAPGKSKASVIAYGETAEVLQDFEFNNQRPFSALTLRTDQFLHGNSRRIDLALAKAKNILKAEEITLSTDQQKKVVILLTSGNHSAEKDNVLSSCEEIHELGYQLIVVPFGIYIDLKELSMMIKRPQALFPFLSLDELLSRGVERMAMEIRKNSGLFAVFFIVYFCPHLFCNNA